jgi:hypothetical protein
VVTLLNRAHIGKWFTARCVDKDIHEEDLYYNGVTLRLDHSIFNNEHNWEGLCDHIKRLRIFA